MMCIRHLSCFASHAPRRLLTSFGSRPTSVRLTGQRGYSHWSIFRCGTPAVWSLRNCGQRMNSTRAADANTFSFRRAILMRKITRYEYEKLATPEMNEEEIKMRVTAKGSDYQGLLDRHTEYMHSLEEIEAALVWHSVEYRLVSRYEYDEDLVDWADVVLTAGGDGTFLMAASLIRGRSTPIVGINTDPSRSEGILCLPKYYSSNINQAITQLKEGDFKWRWRQRIRITLSNSAETDKPLDLQKQSLEYPEFRFWEHVREQEEHVIEKEEAHSVTHSPDGTSTKVLPILALNEVFVGESLSARMSFYELSVDGAEAHKQKSSGLTVCTGTGSTSWFFNINHVQESNVAEILNIAQKYGCQCEPTINNKSKLRLIADEYNSALRFDAADLMMAYTVRDATSFGIFQVHDTKGWCKKLKVRSRMWDAWVVVDGSLSYRFNDGATVELSVHPEDALRCVQLN